MGRRSATGAGGEWTRYVVPAERAGVPLREILTGEMGLSGRMIQRLTRSRGILLNHRPGYLQRAVRSGDVVAARTAPREEATLTPVAMPLSVLYDDGEVLIVDKPPGLLVHPTAPEHTRTLAHGIAHHLASNGRAARVRAVHRLDRDTSGLVLFAGSAGAHATLDAHLRAGEIDREYLALVHGRIEEDEVVLDAPIGRHRGNPTLRQVRDDGDEAATHVRVVARYPATTLVRLRLQTGRTHQIRVHLSHAGHAVVGDREYGSPARGRGVRQALHAGWLAFPHPTRPLRLTVSSPLPPDLVRLLRDARSR